MVVEAGVAKSPGLWIACTGTVTGWNLGSVKVTEKPASGRGTATEQGVLQPGPTEVTASAPEGTELQLDLDRLRRRFQGIPGEREQPARDAPPTAMAIIRRMIHT